MINNSYLNINMIFPFVKSLKMNNTEQHLKFLNIDSTVWLQILKYA